MHSIVFKLYFFIALSFPFSLMAHHNFNPYQIEKTFGDSLGKIVEHYDFGADLYVSSFQDVEGMLKTILEKHKGKSIILDLWGTFCPPCIADFKNSSDIKKQLRDMDVVMVYLCAGRSSNPSKWKEVIEENKLVGTHIYMDSDMTSKYMEKFNFRNYPGYVFVDKNGKYDRFLVRGVASIHPPSFNAKINKD